MKKSRLKRPAREEKCIGAARSYGVTMTPERMPYLFWGRAMAPHRKDRFHNDPEIFALFEEASQVFDPAERQKVLNDLYLRLRDEHYQLGIGYYNIIWATGPRISTWRPNPIALYPSALHTLTLK